MKTKKIFFVALVLILCFVACSSKYTTRITMTDVPITTEKPQAINKQVTDVDSLLSLVTKKYGGDMLHLFNQIKGKNLKDSSDVIDSLLGLYRGKNYDTTFTFTTNSQKIASIMLYRERIGNSIEITFTDKKRLIIRDFSTLPGIVLKDNMGTVAIYWQSFDKKYQFVERGETCVFPGDTNYNRILSMFLILFTSIVN